MARTGAIEVTQRLKRQSPQPIHTQWRLDFEPLRQFNSLFATNDYRPEGKRERALAPLISPTIQALAHRRHDRSGALRGPGLAGPARRSARQSDDAGSCVAAAV